VGKRLSELADYSTDIVFLQESTRGETSPSVGQIFARSVVPQKGIVLGSPNADYRLAELEPSANLRAAVLSPLHSRHADPGN
jgi:hypothetical protein